MRRARTTVTVSFILLAAGATTAAFADPVPKALTYDEAKAFERSLPARSVPEVHGPEVYTQPVNKKEPCKLPTTREQLERSNFRAYWDGQCRNGYAFGLGRDIAISDTHHVEEITVHKAAGEQEDSPRVFYDFVNKQIRYTTPAGKAPAAAWFMESIVDQAGNFFVQQLMGSTDEAGKNLWMEYSPLRPARLLFNDTGAAVFRFIDNAAMPVVDASTVAFSADSLDPRTKVVGGVAVVRFGNGVVRHGRLGGAAPEPVTLPPDYLNELGLKYKAVRDSLPLTQERIARAQQIEREYLYMACNGTHKIEGLDNATATQICNWRGQFQAPYEKALARYNAEMDQLKARAQQYQQQLAQQQQQQLARQQQQQQQRQQGLQELVSAFGEMGQQIRNAGQQSLNSVQPAAPTVNFAPFKAQGGSDRVLCMSTGSFINCRDQ